MTLGQWKKLLLDALTGTTEPYRCPECRCPPNCVCCDKERGCTCMEDYEINDGLGP
jgi:hypothetical protein